MINPLPDTGSLDSMLAAIQRPARGPAFTFNQHAAPTSMLFNICRVNYSQNYIKFITNGGKILPLSLIAVVLAAPRNLAVSDAVDRISHKKCPFSMIAMEGEESRI